MGYKRKIRSLDWQKVQLRKEVKQSFNGTGVKEKVREDLKKQQEEKKKKRSRK